MLLEKYLNKTHTQWWYANNGSYIQNQTGRIPNQLVTMTHTQIHMQSNNTIIHTLTQRDYIPKLLESQKIELSEIKLWKENKIQDFHTTLNKNIYIHLQTKWNKHTTIHTMISD